MRCPTCGTENTPDSRFCGGCGAKQLPSQPPRLAPTTKISDDATFPQSIPPNTYAAPGYASGPQSGPQVSYRPPSMPPPAYPTPPPGSVPPYPAPRQASTPSGSRVDVGDPSRSMPAVARPRWGLIAVVLVVDVGLATAGGLMLAKGLAKPDHIDAAPTKSDPSPIQIGSDPTTPTGGARSAPSGSAAPTTGSASGSASGSVHAASTDEAAPAVAVTAAAEPKLAGSVRAPVARSGHREAKQAAPKATEAYDPARALTSEVELQATRARDTFDRCYGDAGATAIHGNIEIAFQVTTDGRITNVNVVDNTTGSLQLANCLTGTIAHWSFATHPTSTSSFVRPFNYP